MIYRLFPTKDSFITNYKDLGTPQTGSNFGLSEIVNLFVIGYTSGTTGISSGSSARILTKFDLSNISSLIQSGRAPSSGISYRLRMKNAPHGQTLPSSYDVEILPIATDWDEGTGLDNDDFLDHSYCNWTKAKSSVAWNVPGGDVVASPYTVSHFDQGDEDLSADVTQIVTAWMTGTIANNGFMVRMSSTLESGSTDYYLKMFHTRHTNFGDRLPYLEASWDDSIKDDRNNFIFDASGSLFLYRKVRGAFTNLPNVGLGSVNVKVTDSTGNIILNTTGSYRTTGVYGTSFLLPTGSYTGSIFHDVWYSGSAVYMTGTFYPTDALNQEGQGQSPYFVNVMNLNNQYESDELLRLRMFVRPRDYNPAVVLTASAGPLGNVITKGYYRIDNDRTNEIVIPFGTGTVENTRLSYDQSGNYFDLFTRNLPAGNVYRILFLFDADGNRQIIDRDFKFKVF